MENFIEALKNAWAWFMSSPLPRDTALSFANALEHGSKIVIALLNEYITVIFGLG